MGVNDSKESRRAYDKEYRAKNRDELNAKHRMYRNERKDHYRMTDQASRDKRNSDPVLRKKNIVSNCKYRAQRDDYEFNLTVDDLEWPEYCPVFGIKLNYQKSRWGYDGPSVDKVDNTKGYTKENCRVISLRANTLKSNATLEQLERLVQYVKGEI